MTVPEGPGSAGRGGDERSRTMIGSTEVRGSGEAAHGIGAGLSQRRFSREEVGALVREVQAMHAEEQSGIPYESVRSILAELEIEPVHLDAAIRRQGARGAGDRGRAGSWPARLTPAAGVLVAAATIAFGLGFPFGWPSPEGRSDTPVSPAAEVDRPAKAQPAPQPPGPRQASVRQLRELQQQSLLVAG